MNIPATRNTNEEIHFPFAFTGKIEEKHVNIGITPEFLQSVWEILNHSLILGEYKNLWLMLSDNSKFAESCSGKKIKALHYLFPDLIIKAKASGYSYLLIASDAHSKVPDYAKACKIMPRYINSETRVQVNEISLREGRDNWPKFRAVKESVSSVLLVKRTHELFVLLGRNKSNQSGRNKVIGTITGMIGAGEEPIEAAKREMEEETRIKLDQPGQLVATTLDRNYYPSADDRNEVYAFFIDLDKDKRFEIKEYGETFSLVQNGQEAKAGDDLAEVHFLPVERALKMMKPELSGYQKVQAAVRWVQEGMSMQSQTVSFGWGSNLKMYDNVKLYTPHMQKK